MIKTIVTGDSRGLGAALAAQLSEQDGVRVASIAPGDAARQVLAIVDSPSFGEEVIAEVRG